MRIRTLLAGALLFAAAIAQAATSLQVNLPASATTGQAFSFTVRAMNGGLMDPAYTGTVHFTSSDSGATLPAPYAFTPADAGEHTFSATMATAGPIDATRNQTITATDGSNSSITGTGVTTVQWAPDVVRRIVVDVPEEVDRTVPFQGQVSAWNADEQIVPGYRGTVHFRSTDGVTLPADTTFTASDNGTRTFSFTANRGGQHVITSEDVSAPETGSSDSFYVHCPELTATASNNGPVCPNGSDSTILLGSSNQTGVSYSWSGPRAWFSTEQNPTALFPGTYFLEVTNADGCRASASTIVGSKELRSPQFVVPDRVCAGQTATATVTDGASFSNFEWLLDGPATIVSGQGTSSIQIVAGTPQQNTSVDVRVSATDNAAGCRSTFSEPITVALDGPSAAITVAILDVCANGSVDIPVTLSGTPPFTLVWSDGVTQTGITSLTPVRTVAPDVSGAYGIVTVSDASCFGTSIGNVLVNVDDGPTLLSQSPNVTIARGGTTTLQVDVAGLDLTYDWYRGTAGDRSQRAGSGPSPSFTTPPLTQTTTYWVEASGACGSVRSQSIVVSIAQKRRAARH